MTGSDDRKWCLEYRVEAKCSTTKARAGQISLAHGNVSTPVFMPVGHTRNNEGNKCWTTEIYEFWNNFGKHVPWIMVHDGTTILLMNQERK